MISQADIDQTARLCCNDPEAMDFAFLWCSVASEKDDVIDGERTERRDQLLTDMKAVVLYSHPFYLKHMHALRQVILNVIIAYADSVDWERSGVKWKEQFADTLRHCGLEVLIAIACIKGGPVHAAQISRELREAVHFKQHPVVNLKAA